MSKHPVAVSVYVYPAWVRQLRLRHALVALSVIFIGIVGTPFWIRYLPDSVLYSSEFGVVGRIEAFRRATGALPRDLRALHLSEDLVRELRYDVEPADRYTLMFMAAKYGFFGSMNYDSSTGEWTGHD